MKVDNSFWHTNLLQGKTALILVPHEDDELFLSGTVIVELKKLKCNVLAAFSTNGDNGQSACERITQSLKALKKLKIDESDVYFLGYGDQYDSEYGHLYHAPQNEIVRSKAGHTETYGISVKRRPSSSGVLTKNDWCYQKNGYHRPYTSSGFLKDIEELLLSFRPDIIFCNDMDWHPDHRALSLSFDRALGIILKNNPDYAPYVYKGFVYFTAWDAPPDFDSVNPVQTKRPYRCKLFSPKYELENPYFSWQDRVRFPVFPSLLYNRSFLNPILQAIRQYKFSMHACQYAKGAINSDQVFWQRRTDNLALHGDVTTSSGRAEYLNDFMLLDSSNICKTRNIVLDKGVWIPDETDEKKCVCIDLHEHKKIEKIIIYRGIAYADRRLTVKVFYPERSENGYNLLGTFSADSNQLIIPIPLKNCKLSKICLQFVGDHIGISEIEVFEQSRQPLPLFIKTQINGNFAYRYRIGNEKQLFLNIYQYMLNGHVVTRRNIKYKIYGMSKKELSIERNQIKFRKGFKSAYIKFYLKENPLIYDTIKITR